MVTDRGINKAFDRDWQDVEREKLNGRQMSRRLIALWALVLAGCGATSVVPEGAGAAPEWVTGKVTYRERIALSQAAVLKVQLVDVSRADAPAIVIGEQVIRSNGNQVPFAFEIACHSTTSETNHSYAVQARIEDDGRLSFINGQRYAVIAHVRRERMARLVVRAGLHRQ
jgi:putative lipoprotein